MTFALDLAKFAEKAKGLANDLVRDVVAEVAISIDTLSPVGDPTYWAGPPPAGYVGGHFRANWQLGIDRTPQGTINGVDVSPQGGGGTTTQRLIAAIPAEAAGHVFIIANNVPYALRIEDGWSRQTPQGVVGITATKFQAIVDEAVAGLDRT
jgi:hypothetical protein